MEKAPYPPCHAKPDNAGDCVFSHFEEDVFSSSTSCAMVMVRERWMGLSPETLIGNASHAKAFAAGIARYGGKIAVERGPYRGVKEWRTVFGAEDDMNEDAG